MSCIDRLIIVTHIDREHAIREVLVNGVDGYLSKASSLDEVECGLRQVLLGSRFVCERFSSLLVSALNQPRLTSREQTVLSLIAVGLSSKAVARVPDVAPGTVKSHMRAILSKPGGHSPTEAAHVARQRGLVPVADPCVAGRMTQLP